MSAPRTSDSGPLRHVCDIARGGMGRVELVVRQDGDFVRLYARKRLLRDLVDDEDSRSMFLDEARIAGMLRHPNVVSVHDIGEDDGGLFLLMDYIEGVPLSRLIRSAREGGRLLPVQLCVEVLRQVAEGLHAAHELRDLNGEPLHLVHRDVSPSNILVELNGTVRVADFGIARAVGRKTRTSTGLLKGKMGYLPPEVLRFEKPDRRSDLYSLGIVLYETLHCRRLYTGELTDVAKSILNDPAPDFGGERNDVPESLVELGFELLAKDPDHRPPSAKDVARRLGAVLLELHQYEEPLAIEEFVADHVDTNPILARRSQAEEVSHRLRLGLDEPEASPADATSSPKRFPVGFAIGGAALLAVGSVIGFAVSQTTGEETPNGEPASEEVAPLVEEVVQAPMVEPVDEDTAETVETAEPEPEPETAMERRRDNRVRDRRPAMEPPIDNNGMMLEPWDW